MVVIRYSSALVFAAVITFSLFFIMQYLIVSSNNPLDDDVAGYIVDFVQLEREEIVQTKKSKPKKPPPPESPPPEPPAPKLDKAKPNADIIEIAAVPVTTDIEISTSGFSLNTGDSEYLPLVKIQPIYPRRALARGIEGYVILEFTVTRQGTVKDIKVIKSDPKTTIFHDAAIKAAGKFKYKPRVVDGQAIEVPGVKNKISFKIER
jgi:protein TonB